MTINCTPPNRVYNQYQGKTKLNQWFDSTLSVSQSICDASNAVKSSYSIDDNGGAQLDIIGRIVGKSRGFIDTIELDVIQCNSDGEHECGDSEAQCSQTSVAGDAALSDMYYRLILKSKIAKNNNTCTSDDILKAMKAISPAANFVRVVDNYDMSITIEYNGVIDDVTADLLRGGDIVPLAQGVSLKEVIKV